MIRSGDVESGSNQNHRGEVCSPSAKLTAFQSISLTSTQQSWPGLLK